MCAAGLGFASVGSGDVRQSGSQATRQQEFCALMPAPGQNYTAFVSLIARSGPACHGNCSSGRPIDRKWSTIYPSWDDPSPPELLRTSIDVRTRHWTCGEAPLLPTAVCHTLGYRFPDIGAYVCRWHKNTHGRMFPKSINCSRGSKIQSQRSNWWIAFRRAL